MRKYCKLYFSQKYAMQRTAITMQQPTQKKKVQKLISVHLMLPLLLLLLVFIISNPKTVHRTNSTPINSASLFRLSRSGLHSHGGGGPDTLYMCTVPYAPRPLRTKPSNVIWPWNAKTWENNYSNPETVHGGRMGHYACAQFGSIHIRSEIMYVSVVGVCF